MKSGCIYYTDNTLDPKILTICQKQLQNSFDGEIINVSLAPMDFGKNIVLANRKRSYPTYLYQIKTALENSTADTVFFTEHDVLYHPTHFKLKPKKSNIYYYNINNYRWRYMTEIAITYSGLTSLSMLFCNRELALRHFKYRIKVMEKNKLDRLPGREPRWARRFGYEPGTKPVHKGGITDETHIKVKSEYPNIDIRHNGTFSRPKTFKKEFKHLPPDFTEVNIDDIPEWNLKELFYF